jgi:hypothetical protein
MRGLFVRWHAIRILTWGRFGIAQPVCASIDWRVPEMISRSFGFLVRRRHEQCTIRLFEIDVYLPFFLRG